MKIKVLFFGFTHDLTGLHEEQVEIGEGENLQSLRRIYETRFPRLGDLAGSLLFAVNQQIAEPLAVLHEGDEVDIHSVVIIHRVGRLEIGETSVAIVVTAAHRQPAFEACHYLIDRLKQVVPVWKKEYFESGAVWAEGEGRRQVLAGARR